MTATKPKRKPTREQAMRTWMQAGAQRAQDARDEQRIDLADHEREWDHLSPAVDEQIQAVQDRYERACGMTHD